MAAPLDGFPVLPALCRRRYDNTSAVEAHGETRMTIKGTLPPWAILAAIGAIGLGLLVAGNIGWGSWKDWPVWAHGLSRDIGIALLTTSVLGFTVDRWLKLDIAVDVFKAALGYVMPDDFRDEVRRISEYKLIAEKHSLIFDIQPLDQDTVQVIGMIEKTVRNISSESLPYYALVAIDEWGFTNAKSQILECEVRDEAGNQQKFSIVDIKDKESVLEAKTKTISIPPNGRAFSSSKFIEIRRANDHIMMVSTTPGRNPEIEVRISPNFDYTAGFGGPTARVETAKYSFRHTLIGMYFPNQPMRVRWWPKKVS